LLRAEITVLGASPSWDFTVTVSELPRGYSAVTCGSLTLF
jgi:hypothetical protein